MTGLTFTFVALAGGLGAASRYLADWLIGRTAAFPRATLIINVAGSFLIGLLAGLALTGLGEQARIILSTGFLGGFTTFSTASVETVRLISEGKRGPALAYSAGTLISTLLACIAGLIIGESSTLAL